MSADYRLVLAGRSDTGLGTPIISDVFPLGVPFAGDEVARWGQTLNAAGALEFTLPIDACSATDFAPGQRELHLYRDAGSGESLVWGGHLWTADVRAPWVRFMGLGFYEAFRHREIGDDFYKQSVEQRALAWQLIQYTQGLAYGDLGITLGSATGSPVNRTVDHCAEERDNVADAIEDLASADNGFDFEVSPNKVWNTYYPQRGSDLSGSVVLNTTTHIADMSYTYDATQVENEVAGIGKTGDCEPIHYLTLNDDTSKNLFGLMQGTLVRSDVRQDNTMIDDLVARRLALRKVVRQQPVIRLKPDLSALTPLAGTFGLGDDIMIQSSWGYATFTSKFRVMAYLVSFDQMGTETMDLTLDAVP
jgi:hypothetical protein